MPSLVVAFSAASYSSSVIGTLPGWRFLRIRCLFWPNWSFRACGLLNGGAHVSLHTRSVRMSPSATRSPSGREPSVQPREHVTPGAPHPTYDRSERTTSVSTNAAAMAADAPL